MYFSIAEGDNSWHLQNPLGKLFLLNTEMATTATTGISLTESSTYRNARTFFKKWHKRGGKYMYM